MMKLAPDGGTAVHEGKLHLPEYIMVSDTTVLSGPAQEIRPGETMFGLELYGHLFSFVVSMSMPALRAHLQRNLILPLTNFKVGQPQVSAITGETFRDILCEPMTKEIEVI